MGLLDFFKKGPSTTKQVDEQQSSSVDANSYLHEKLEERLIQSGYRVVKHPHYLALVVSPEIEIVAAIVDNPSYHSSILQLRILTTHAKYFPNGIRENIVGIGKTLQEKVNSVIDNYVYTTFLPIIDSFSDSHNPQLDFSTMTSQGKEILWHPKLGNLTFQGQWDSQPTHEPFFEIIKDTVGGKLTSNKLNWLKLYISKRADGTIIGECLFNNEPWDEGLAEITEYARSWKMKSDFQGLKQFIMFRKCDASDE